MDLAGSLLESVNGNLLLIVVNVCTRFVFLKPIHDKQAITVGNALFDIFCTIGSPMDTNRRSTTRQRRQLCLLSQQSLRPIRGPDGSEQEFVRSNITVINVQSCRNKRELYNAWAPCFSNLYLFWDGAAPIHEGLGKD